MPPSATTGILKAILVTETGQFVAELGKARQVVRQTNEEMGSSTTNAKAAWKLMTSEVVAFGPAARGAQQASAAAGQALKLMGAEAVPEIRGLTNAMSGLLSGGFTPLGIAIAAGAGAMTLFLGQMREGEEQAKKWAEAQRKLANDLELVYTRAADAISGANAARLKPFQQAVADARAEIEKLGGVENKVAGPRFLFWNDKGTEDERREALNKLLRAEKELAAQRELQRAETERAVRDDTEAVRLKQLLAEAIDEEAKAVIQLNAHYQEFVRTHTTLNSEQTKQLETNRAATEDLIHRASAEKQIMAERATKEREMRAAWTDYSVTLEDFLKRVNGYWDKWHERQRQIKEFLSEPLEPVVTSTSMGYWNEDDARAWRERTSRTEEAERAITELRAAGEEDRRAILSVSGDLEAQDLDARLRSLLLKMRNEGEDTTALEKAIAEAKARVRLKVLHDAANEELQFAAAHEQTLLSIQSEGETSAVRLIDIDAQRRLSALRETTRAEVLELQRRGEMKLAAETEAAAAEAALRIQHERDLAKAIAGDNLGAGFFARIEQMKSRAGGLGSLGAQFAELGTEGAAGGLADALEDIARNGRDAGEALRAFGEDFAWMAARVASQYAILQVLMTLFGAIGTSSAGAGGNQTGGPTGPGNWVTAKAAHGGSWRVGGFGGLDSQLVAMKLTPGELVRVTPPGGATDAGPITVALTIRPPAVIADEVLARSSRESKAAVVAHATYRSGRRGYRPGD